MEGTGYAIEAEGLTKRFVTGRGRRRRDVSAVAGVSLRVESGERLAFIGPNGAGKSTSIKMLTGILHPTAGTATVLGLIPWRDRIQLAARIGALFGQRSQLWAELTPRQSFRMLAAIYGMSGADERRRVGELGDLLQAGDLFDTPVRTHSLGQRMRCELAACLLHEPEILFLDEPTIGLDLLAKQRFRELLVELNTAAGTTIFLTSHDVADIEHVAERVVVINHGAVILDDSVVAIRRSLLATKIITVGLGEPAQPLAITGAMVSSQSPSAVRLVVDTNSRSIRDVLDDVLGYSGVALSWYVATSEAAICALNLRLIPEISDDIAGGAVTVELLRPTPLLLVRLAIQLGKTLVRLAAIGLAGAGLCLLTAGRPPSAAGLALAVPSLVIAVAINIAMQHVVAGAAFWIRDARSTWFLYQKVIFIAGGMLLPLEVLPDTLRDVAFRLPFMAVAYAPARLASGHAEPHLLLVQAGWLVVAVALAAVTFAAGQRRLQAVGA